MLKNLGFTVRCILLPKPLNRVLDYSQRPIAVEPGVRRHCVCRFQSVTLFCREGIKVDDSLAATALRRAVPFPAFSEKMLQRRLQKIAETSIALSHVRQIALLKHPFEECLGKVFGVLGGTALAPHKSVQGIPVDLAKLLQGGTGDGRISLASSQHDAPVGGGELSVLPQTWWRGVCGRNHEG